MHPNLLFLLAGVAITAMGQLQLGLFLIIGSFMIDDLMERM